MSMIDLSNLYIILTMDELSNPRDEMLTLGVSFDEFDKWYFLFNFTV